MLAGYQRTYLRGLAHHLEPVVHVGKDGLSAGLEAEVDHALEAHELVKVRFQGRKEERHALAPELAARTRSELVGTIGNVALLYRQNPDPEKRKVVVPQRPPGPGGRQRR